MFKIYRNRPPINYDRVGHFFVNKTLSINVVSNAINGFRQWVEFEKTNWYMNIVDIWVFIFRDLTHKWGYVWCFSQSGRLKWPFLYLDYVWLLLLKNIYVFIVISRRGVMEFFIKRTSVVQNLFWLRSFDLKHHKLENYPFGTDTSDAWEHLVVHERYLSLLWHASHIKLLLIFSI